MDGITPRSFKRAKILATVGPAVSDFESIKDMVRAGVNGFRLNFSHGTHEERPEQIDWIRKASKAAGLQATILQDLQGPKIRLGDFTGTVTVKEGDELELAYGETKKGQLPVQYDLSQKVKIGERLYLFDGKVRSVVVKVEPGVITIKIGNDGVLLQRKGINLPDTDFAGDIITEKDIKDLIFGASQDIDYVALSFVQTADDIKRLRTLLAEHKSTARVIAKIETQRSIEDHNLEAIIMEADGVMVARGDLAVETSPEIVPIIQRRIIELAQKHSKLSIVATQMLASMTVNPEPTRAEVSDVATAVICGADALMLSEETAQGRYPIEAIETMRRVIMYTQIHSPLYAIAGTHRHGNLEDTISAAATAMAHQINAQAIVCETKTGQTAFSIASHRPDLPIISVTSSPRVAQQLSLLYANKSFLHEDGERAGWEIAKDLANQGILEKGKPVVLVSGRQPGLTGGTDTIRIRILE